MPANDMQDSEEQKLDERLTFLCSLHLDEVQRRRKEANLLAVTTLLALIILVSLAMGYAQSRTEALRVSESAGRLRDLVEAHQGIKALNMAQLPSLKEDVRQAALDLTSLVPSPPASPRCVFRTKVNARFGRT